MRLPSGSRFMRYPKVQSRDVAALKINAVFDVVVRNRDWISGAGTWDAQKPVFHNKNF